MDFWLIAYILTSVVLGASLVSLLYKAGQNVGAIGLAILLILIYVFYGLRWFKDGSLKGTTVNGKIQWPPIINMCPDFMSSYKDPTTKKVYCYDAGNFYDMKTYSGAGQRDITVNGVAGQKGILIKDIQGTQMTYPLLQSEGNFRAITSDAKGTYVKWEGVYDGLNYKKENLSKAPKP